MTADRRVASRRARRNARLPRAAFAAAFALALAGCGVEYTWQAAAGQLDLIARARPVDEVIATTPDPRLAERLKLATGIRTYASVELGLPDNASYRRYADLGRPYVVWNLVATPALSLQPREWCFPVAGCVSYRGYFREEDARREAARLAAAGDDVHVSGVPAYSTLGWFDDPLLSSFVRYPDVELARLVFHELAHQRVYVRDDTAFNESFATAVEEAGLARWIASRPPAEAARLAADRDRHDRLRTLFRRLVVQTRERLESVYSGDGDDGAKQRAKAAAFAALREAYERGMAGEPGLAGYERWFAGAGGSGPNNASLVSVALYEDLVPAFRELLARERGDLAAFYRRVEALAALPRDERRRALGAPAS